MVQFIGRQILEEEGGVLIQKLEKKPNGKGMGSMFSFSYKQSSKYHFFLRIRHVYSLEELWEPEGKINPPMGGGYTVSFIANWGKMYMHILYIMYRYKEYS